MSQTIPTVCPPVSGTFAGLSVLALQAALMQAQQALINLETGALVATVSYAQGEGNRSVTYSRADSGRLRQLIAELQAALGLRARRAIGVRFA
ncbi:gpW family head-tail joining protein [Rhodopila sp.]|uniref:gpW family head-tail joining protein n=1 Tax=Rhodopila sp. TaxID=2480087 RepID=UPI003D11BA78